MVMRKSIKDTMDNIEFDNKETTVEEGSTQEISSLELHTLDPKEQVRILRRRFPKAIYFAKMIPFVEKNKANDISPQFRPNRVYAVLDIMYRDNNDPICMFLDIRNQINYLIVDQFEFIPEA